MARPVLIVAHGQPGDPAAQEQAIKALAARVGALLPGQQVSGVTLASEGALAAALAPEALIYPMFMAGGWFTKVELPRRLALTGVCGIKVLPPFGADPSIATLALALLREAADLRGWALSDVTVLIAAHGSGRSRAPAQAAQDLAQALRSEVAQIRCGFVEEAPFLADAARDLGVRAICLPFFATQAGHIIEDLPQALEEASFDGVVLPPIGMANQVPALIAAAIRWGG